MDTNDQLLQVADTDAVMDNSSEEIVQAEEAEVVGYGWWWYVVVVGCYDRWW